MISKNVYYRLKKEFGKYSSWAIWSECDPEKPKSNVSDMSVFNNKELFNTLKTNYILVGLNASNHDDDKKEKDEAKDWQGFHSKNNRKQNDYKIRYAIAGTKLWGSYMTDVFKGIKEKESKRVKKMVKKDLSLLDKAKNCLAKELKIIGGEPILIAFGNDSWYYLNKIAPELGIEKIVKIRHYSCWGGQEKYKEIIWKQLKDQNIKL